MNDLSPRTPATLYARRGDPWALRLRVVLAEKALDVEPRFEFVSALPAAVLDVNPLQAMPMLVDRSIALYAGWVIEQYLDARYPSPPMQPVDPTKRALIHVVLYRIEHEWYPLVSGDPRRIRPNDVTRAVASAAALFESKPFFLSDTFSIADAALVPVLLWAKLADLPAPIRRYANRLFPYPAVQHTLSERP